MLPNTLIGGQPLKAGNLGVLKESSSHRGIVLFIYLAGGFFYLVFIILLVLY